MLQPQSSKHATWAPIRPCIRSDPAPRSFPPAPAPLTHHDHSTCRPAVSGRDPENGFQPTPAPKVTKIYSIYIPSPSDISWTSLPAKQSAATAARQMLNRQQAKEQNEKDRNPLEHMPAPALTRPSKGPYSADMTPKEPQLPLGPRSLLERFSVCMKNDIPFTI